MGNKHSITYAAFVGEEKEGESRVLRHNRIFDGPLRVTPDKETTTLYKAWKRTVNRNPEKDFLGTREFKGEAVIKDEKGVEKKQKEYGPYDWIKMKDVDRMAESYAKALLALDFCPLVDADGRQLRFLGLYSRNMAEWVISDVACIMGGVTTVCLYDTLGADTTEYIVN